MQISTLVYWIQKKRKTSSNSCESKQQNNCSEFFFAKLLFIPDSQTNHICICPFYFSSCICIVRRFTTLEYAFFIIIYLTLTVKNGFYTFLFWLAEKSICFSLDSLELILCTTIHSITKYLLLCLSTFGCTVSLLIFFDDPFFGYFCLNFSHSLSWFFFSLSLSVCWLPG